MPLVYAYALNRGRNEKYLFQNSRGPLQSVQAVLSYLDQ